MKNFKSTLIYSLLLFINSTVNSQMILTTIEPNKKWTDHTGYSTLIDRLGSNQISEILTLNLAGTEYTFDVHEGKKEDIKTFKIITSGNYNYSIKSTSLNKDNRRHEVYGSGAIFLDRAKNYVLEIYGSTNPDRIWLEVKDIASANTTTLIQPNRTDKRIGGISPANAPYFMRNGQKPIRLLLLDNVMNEKFYIYADGVIQVYNITNNTLGICGQKAPPYYGSWNGKVWAWSFYRNIGNNLQETYTISTTGEVWALSQDGSFKQFGYVTYIDF